LGDEANGREFAARIVALKPGNYVTVNNKISMCSEPLRTRRCEVVHCATTG
jgi:hypothetical protein